MRELRDSADRDFERHLLRLGLDPNNLTLDSSGTLAALTRPREDADVPPLSRSGEQELEVGRVIGKGGMGVVRAAVQRALGREVAIKQLRPDAEDAYARSALVSEAKITGHLEHPNVVPIHSLTTDADGRPALVMKLIDGSLWSDLLASEELLRRDHPDAGDPLEFHLDVMMSVCNALEFAHARGVVHRDVKPANVMIGRFGEVYLLDWGLAVGLREDGPEHLPLARDIAEPAGSPGYMSPEMAAGEGELVNERTDVYLIGAALHEVLTGRPPHVGATLLQTLESAFRAEPPQLGDEVPRELAEICRRALAFDPEDRFASARDLHTALAQFLRHRAARALREEADRKAGEAERETDDKLRLRALTEARFAYQLALREWPDNTETRRGLERVLEHLVRTELERGQVAAARELLGEMASASPELERELAAGEEGLARERRRVNRLEELRADTDIGRDERTRTVQIYFIGTVVVLMVTTLTVLRVTGVIYTTPLVACVVMATVTVTAYIAGLGMKQFNEANRKARAAFLMILGMGTAYLAVATWIGQDLTLALAILMFLFAGGATFGSSLLHRSGVITALVFFAMGIALLLFPAYRPYIMPVGLLLAFSTMAYVSRRAAADAPVSLRGEERPPR